MPPSLSKTRFSTEARQTEIILAVLSLAAQHSPNLITTSDIAKALGLTQGAIFKHFANKEAIWLAVMQWVAENLQRALEQAEQAAPSIWDALHAVFMAHVGFVATHPGVPRLIFSELQQSADTPLKAQVRHLLTAYRLRLLRLLGGLAQDGQLDDDVDQAAAAALFIGTIQGLVMQSMLMGNCQRMESEAASAFALYRRAIRRQA